jgi:type IV secretory pathway VirJ component
MPISIVPATGNSGPDDLMAVVYSGDGGWVGIDRAIADQLAAKGIPVVGVDSLSYFWSARTPAGAGRDLQRIIAGYGALWRRPRVMLIGYSFGADAMPAMIGAMDPAIRSRIDSLSLLGLSSTAEFQFHLGSWLDMASSGARPTLPAILHLKGMDIRCVRGSLETDSACPAIPKGVARQVVVPGGHHFDRNSALLANIILSSRA